MLISINGKIMEEGDSAIAPTSEAFLYGYGAFETIKFSGNRIHFFKEHYARLKEACETLQLPLEYDLRQIERFCWELIEGSKIHEGGLKVLYGKNHEGSYLLITVAENKYRQESYRDGFKLCFTDIKRNPYSLLTYIKSNNYLENLLARKQALEKGYDEVVFENVHGNLCEGAIGNLFFVRSGKVCTPHESCGLLTGIMRSRVIEVAGKLKIPVEISKYRREELIEADEIFISNSLMEIMPVVQLENRMFDINDNRITEKIRQALIR